MGATLDNYQNHENRIAKLEQSVENSNSEVVQAVRSLEKRLIGSIDTNTPGLVTEMREIKKEVEYCKSKITRIETCVNDFSRNLLPAQQLTERIEKIQENLESLNTHRWILYGIIIGGGIIIKGWEVLAGLGRMLANF